MSSRWNWHPYDTLPSKKVGNDWQCFWKSISMYNRVFPAKLSQMPLKAVAQKRHSVFGLMSFEADVLIWFVLNCDEYEVITVSNPDTAKRSSLPEQSRSERAKDRAAIADMFHNLHNWLKSLKTKEVRVSTPVFLLLFTNNRLDFLSHWNSRTT